MQNNIHWIDLPSDNLSAILGYSSEKTQHLCILNQKYQSLDKNNKFLLEERIDKLTDFINYLSNWLTNAVQAKDKIKHLKWLQDIADKKRNYLLEISKIRDITNIKEYLHNYHFPPYKNNKDELEHLHLNSKRLYSIKKREYWGDFWIVSLDPCHRQLTNYLMIWEKLSTNNNLENIVEFFLWLETMEVPNYQPYENYLDKEEKSKLAIQIKNGLLYNADSTLVSLNNVNEKYIFVIDTNKELFIAEETKTSFHSCFCKGTPVLSAGKIKIIDGQITDISLESGHYIPSIRSGYQLFQILNEQGYNINHNVNIQFFYDRNKYEAKLNVSTIFHYKEFEKALIAHSNLNNIPFNCLAENPFDTPQKYRQQILENDLLTFEKKTLKGKSLACLFLTRFCSVGCPFCFYKSAPAWRKRNIEDQFSDEGIEKFLQFADKANLGYLLISGGGEPLNQRKHIIKIIQEVAADRIVLVTSGAWAKNFDTAEKYVSQIKSAINQRNTPTVVVLRVSVSSGHCAKIGYSPIRILIEIFRKHYATDPNFILQIKTFENDDTLKKALEGISDIHISNNTIDHQSDNQVLIKKIPKKYSLSFKEGLNVNVGVSKMFLSSLQANLNDPKFIEQSSKVFDEDLQKAEDDNPAIVFNEHGENGIDWSINYNGDICTWQNQVRDNYLNLYEDSYEDIWQANFNDPITYSMLDRDRFYRESVVSEVNPRAVTKMRAIALRDTSGTLIFEEEHTRLYFAIRVLQDYIQEGKIINTMYDKWPSDIKALALLGKDKLKELYKKSEYSIIKQQMLKPFVEQEWLDLFYLIKLNHYELTDNQIQEGIKYFNKHAIIKVENIQAIKPDTGDIERRLTERVMHIKPLKNIDQHNRNLINMKTIAESL